MRDKVKFFNVQISKGRILAPKKIWYFRCNGATSMFRTKHAKKIRLKTQRVNPRKLGGKKVDISQKRRLPWRNFMIEVF